MGNFVCIEISCDQVLNHVFSCVCGDGNYIRKLKENLKALETTMEDLKARRDDLLQRVQREEDRGLQKLQQVQVWLSRVENIENNVNNLLSTKTGELQRLCLCGVCSKKINLSYRYGKMVFLLLKEAEKLIPQGVFDTVAEFPPIAVVEERPLHQATIVGRETMLERAWDRFMDDRVDIIGLYGMGGVGKTTILAQINNKLSDVRCGFDYVIWIVVSKDSRMGKIQDGIAEKLDLVKEGEWNQKEESKKAADIYNFLRKKRFVLLLDDVWTKVDLTEIGVPFPTRQNRCKVVFTTRLRDVCAGMGVHDPIQVQCLTANDAWDLFRMKVGGTTIGSDPEIPNLARRVAEKCRGLPLALNIIGETMACKTAVQEWKHAIEVLSSSAAQFSGMNECVLPLLKYSYDNLKSDQIKSCFQSCALFPEDYLITKERLIDYWICMGLIDTSEGRERAVNKGYEIIGTLTRACLLMEAKGFDRLKQQVKMHDVVHEMAIWVASDLGKNKESFIVQAGVGLRETPKVKNWNDVRQMSLMCNEIEKISGSLKCPELTTLFLQRNHNLVDISGEFLMSMPKLLVLDLSENISLEVLPDQISELISLRYLDLSRTNIVRLPVGLQMLKKLMHLNVEFSPKLESISGISSLSSLRTLRLQHSKCSLDLNTLEELQLLDGLEIITIDISSTLVLERLLRDKRLPNCTQGLFVHKCRLDSYSILYLPGMCNLYSMFVWSCDILQIKIENTSCNRIPTSPCFPNLSYVNIQGCHGLKDLTWLSFAPNLTSLRIRWALDLEEIISEEKFLVSAVSPFRKLKELQLFRLRKLKSIYWCPQNYPCIKEFSVTDCPAFEINTERTRKFSPDPSSRFFRNLAHMRIDRCDGIKDFSWLLFAPSLLHLEISALGEVEEIISKEKITSPYLQSSVVPFQKLHHLSLSDLPKLRSVYWSPLPFPYLGNLTVHRCPLLRKLPLDSRSGAWSEERAIINYMEKEWIQGVEWEDEATKARFLR